MARIARTLALTLAFLTLAIFGASAASASTTVPAQARVTFSTTADEMSIRVADDCTAYVTTDPATGEIVFRDYAPNSEGTMVALAFCEGEQGPRYFVTVGDPGTDGTEAYLVLGLV